MQTKQPQHLSKHVNHVNASGYITLLEKIKSSNSRSKMDDSTSHCMELACFPVSQRSIAAIMGKTLLPTNFMSPRHLVPTLKRLKSYFSQFRPAFSFPTPLLVNHVSPSISPQSHRSKHGYLSNEQADQSSLKFSILNYIQHGYRTRRHQPFNKSHVGKFPPYHEDGRMSRSS